MQLVIQPHHPDPHPPYPRSIIELQYVFDIYWTENDAERSCFTAHPKQVGSNPQMGSIEGSSLFCSFRFPGKESMSRRRSIRILFATLID